MELIRLSDIVQDWDNFRLESMDNMFYQMKNGKMSAFYEAAATYRNAIDQHTKLYCKLVNYNLRDEMY